MKSKAQKQEELNKGAEMLKGSKTLLFADFSQLSTEDIRALRRQLRVVGAKMLVIKKRLLNVLFKQKGVDFETSRFKFSVATIFSPDSTEVAAAPIVKFFKEKKLEKDKVLGAYNLELKSFVDSEQVIFLGQLPSREVLLAQFLGLLVSPIQSFLYILDEKSKAG